MRCERTAGSGGSGGGGEGARARHRGAGTIGHLRLRSPLPSAQQPQPEEETAGPACASARRSALPHIRFEFAPAGDLGVLLETDRLSSGVRLCPGNSKGVADGGLRPGHMRDESYRGSSRRNLSDNIRKPLGWWGEDRDE